MTWKAMPKYVYRCSGCGKQWEHVLSTKEAVCVDWLDCFSCFERAYRVPQSFSVREEKKETPKQVGDITEGFIEEARKELDQQKKEASSKEYKV